MKTGNHLNKKSMEPMLLILLDFIKHFKGSRMYKSTVKYKKQRNPKM